MATPINLADPMVQIVFNNSSISFPLLSGFTILLIILVIIFFLTIIFIKKLPEHIYKRLEKKLDKETELLKIIQSQVEPQKVDIYLTMIETCGDLFAVDITDQLNLPPDEKDSHIKDNKATFILLSSFFLFASDGTIAKYIFMRKNDPVTLHSSPSFIQYADFMVSMRQDLHRNTKIDASHFCSILGIKQSEKE